MYIESNALFLQKGLKDTVQGNSNYQSVLGRAKVTGVTEGQGEKMEKRKKRMSWRRTEAGIIPPRWSRMCDVAGVEVGQDPWNGRRATTCV